MGSKAGWILVAEFGGRVASAGGCQGCGLDDRAYSPSELA